MTAFWPFALIAAVVVIILQLNIGAPSALTDSVGGDRLFYLGALILLILGVSLRFRKAQRQQTLQVSAISCLIFAIGVGGYTYRNELRPVVYDLYSQSNPTVSLARQEGSVTLKKAWDGHFRAVTKINGEKVGMLVDTGASLVLLSYEDAEAIGLSPEKMRFTIPVVTANGKAHVASVTLDSVQIGQIGLFGVRAAVAEKGKMHSSLLGMSFLSRIQETSFRRDTLVLRN